MPRQKSKLQANINIYLLPLELSQPMLEVLAFLGLALEEHHGSFLLLLLRPQGSQLALHALTKEPGARETTKNGVREKKKRKAVVQKKRRFSTRLSRSKARGRQAEQIAHCSSFKLQALSKGALQRSSRTAQRICVATLCKGTATCITTKENSGSRFGTTVLYRRQAGQIQYRPPAH